MKKLMVLKGENEETLITKFVDPHIVCQTMRGNKTVKHWKLSSEVLYEERERNLEWQFKNNSCLLLYVWNFKMTLI